MFWIVFSLLIGISGFTFCVNDQPVNYNIKIFEKRRIIECGLNGYEIRSWFTYDGSLRQAIEKCGQECIDLRIESGNQYACNAVEIVDNDTCRVILCHEAKLRRTYRKNRQRTYVFIPYD